MSVNYISEINERKVPEGQQQITRGLHAAAQRPGVTSTYSLREGGWSAGPQGTAQGAREAQGRGRSACSSTCTCLPACLGEGPCIHLVEEADAGARARGDASSLAIATEAAQWSPAEETELRTDGGGG